MAFVVDSNAKYSVVHTLFEGVEVVYEGTTGACLREIARLLQEDIQPVSEATKIYHIIWSNKASKFLTVHELREGREALFTGTYPACMKWIEAEMA